MFTWMIRRLLRPFGGSGITVPTTGFIINMRARENVLVMRQRQNVLVMKPRA